jgi:MATE family multidrug resistance protein
LSRIMMVVFMHYLKTKFGIEKNILRISVLKKSANQFWKIINLVSSAMQMLFEVTLFTAAIWLSGSLKNQAVAWHPPLLWLLWV